MYYIFINVLNCSIINLVVYLDYKSPWLYDSRCQRTSWMTCGGRSSSHCTLKTSYIRWVERHPQRCKQVPLTWLAVLLALSWFPALWAGSEPRSHHQFKLMEAIATWTHNFPQTFAPAPSAGYLQLQDVPVFSISQECQLNYQQVTLLWSFKSFSQTCALPEPPTAVSGISSKQKGESSSQWLIPGGLKFPGEATWNSCKHHSLGRPEATTGLTWVWKRGGWGIGLH